ETDRVQCELVAIDPPVRLTVLEPATPVAVPPHVFSSPFGVDTTRPAGSGSVNATPAAATVLAVGFVTVNFSVDVALTGTVPGVTAAAISGGATTTCGFPVSDPGLPAKSVSPA